MTDKNTLDWGRTEYNDAYNQQLDYVSKRINQKAPDTLIFTEHNPVYTLGKRIGAENNLIWSEEERSNLGIGISKTNRGGDITYHGPGQIVGYPIISLEKKRDLHEYLRQLETNPYQRPRLPRPDILKTRRKNRYLARRP